MNYNKYKERENNNKYRKFAIDRIDQGYSIFSYT